MTTVVGRGFMKETDFHIALKIYNLGRNPEGRKESEQEREIKRK